MNKEKNSFKKETGPSTIELAETFNTSMKQMKESIADRLDAMDLKFSEDISKVSNETSMIAENSKLPVIENFIRSSKIAGELDRTAMWSMVFQSVLASMIAHDKSALFRYTGSESGRQQREFEVQKILDVTDIFMEALEDYFAPQD